ncbi:MAG TPA: DEAD/DEAH box helicase, partial [Mycobacterium sp.]|nr:DEAD/DEAH box helicase [Mycobacterium sp.]
AALGTMALPKRVEHRQPRVRRDLASALRSAAAGLALPAGRPKSPDRDVDPELADLRAQLRFHSAHQLPDRDAKVRIAERYLRIERDNAQIQKKVAAATNSLARTFDRIVALLSERGFIEPGGPESDGAPTVTDAGRLLARIYSESDLLVAECLRAGVWDGLAPAELAGVLSAVLFESRGDSAGVAAGVDVPTAGLRRALAATRRLSVELRADEQRHRIAPGREPDEGFVAAIHRWATTGDLAAALAASEPSGSGSPLSAGDFVRWCRQVLDLLDQVRNAAPTPALRKTAKRAINDVRRGVVAVDAG